MKVPVRSTSALAPAARSISGAFNFGVGRMGSKMGGLGGGTGAGGGAAFANTAMPKKTQGKTNLWILFTGTSVFMHSTTSVKPV